LPAVSHADVVPLSAHTWLQATGRARLAVLDTGAVLVGSAAWAYLDRFHALALACLAVDAEQRQRTDRECHELRAGAARARLEAAPARLARVLAPRSSRRWAAVEGRDPLFAACWLVGEALGIPIKPPHGAAGASVGDAPLQAIARLSGVRTRRVA